MNGVVVAWSPARDALDALASASARDFSPDLRVLDEPEEGWVALAELAAPERRRENHALIARAAGEGAPRTVPELWEVEAVAWYAGLVAAGCLLRGVPVPELRPDATWVYLGSWGRAAGLAVRPDARCATGVAAAHAAIRDACAPVVCAARPARRPLLWRHVGDSVADAMLWCAAALHADEGRRDEVAAALLDPGESWAVPFVCNADGEHERTTCCLSYRVEPDAYCPGCPHADKCSERGR